MRTSKEKRDNVEKSVKRTVNYDFWYLLTLSWGKPNSLLLLNSQERNVSGKCFYMVQNSDLILLCLIKNIGHLSLFPIKC